MYTVSKGPSKIVAKTRRGLSQNFEKFETIKESGKRTTDINSPEKNNVPRPVFQTKKIHTHTQQVKEEVITPQHEEIIRYINDSWNIIVAHNPYDNLTSTDKSASDTASSSSTSSSASSSGISSSNESVSSTSSVYSSASSSAATSPACSPHPTAAAALYCVEPPSPVLSDFKPFDLESWWGRRLFHSITKSL